MSENYTGFKTFEADGSKIDELYKEGKVAIWDKRYSWHENLYVELIDIANPKHTGLAKVRGGNLVALSTKAWKKIGIQPRNREQIFALDALLDPTIQLVILTGKFGTGKTYCAIAGALAGLEGKLYSKMILSKPMTQIGKHKIGTLPGEISDKYHPYLINYESNFQQLLGKNVQLEDVLNQYNIEFRPIQLFLGASFAYTYVVIDEAANLETIELGALLSRTGEGSKVVIMGDYKQVHDDVKNQGLKKLVNDNRIKNSELVAVVELQKCERSALASLIGEIFDE